MRKKSYLKTGKVDTNNTIDSATAEIIDSNVKKHTYIANSKEEFLLLYVNALPIFINLSNPSKTIYAFLLKDYNSKSVFEIGAGLRTLLSKQLGFAPSTIANALTELTVCKLLHSPSRSLYQLNPRYAFKGSTLDRNDALKAIIELGCKDC